MKIDNNGKPTYEPRRGQKKQPDGGGDWLFWVCVIIAVLVVLGSL